MTASEMLTGTKGPSVRTNLLLPEKEYRYLYAILTEHEPVSEVGKSLIERVTKIMGDRIDKLNKYGK